MMPAAPISSHPIAGVLTGAANNEPSVESGSLFAQILQGVTGIKLGGLGQEAGQQVAAGLAKGTKLADGAVRAVEAAPQELGRIPEALLGQSAAAAGGLLATASENALQSAGTVTEGAFKAVAVAGAERSLAEDDDLSAALDTAASAVAPLDGTANLVGQVVPGAEAPLGLAPQATDPANVPAGGELQVAAARSLDRTDAPNETRNDQPIAPTAVPQAERAPAVAGAGARAGEGERLASAAGDQPSPSGPVADRGKADPATTGTHGGMAPEGLSAAHHARSDVAVEKGSTPPVAAAPMEQVSVRVAKAAASDERLITIRLDPPELGHVEVTLETQKDAVRVALAIERPETLDILRKDSQALDQALARANVRVDGGIEFSLRQQGQGPAGGFGSGGEQRGDGSRFGANGPAAANDLPTRPLAALPGSGAMDIVV